MRQIQSSVLLLFLIFCMTACENATTNPKRVHTLNDYSRLQNSRYAFDSKRIHEHIATLVRADNSSSATVSRTKDYYRHVMSLLWIDYDGVDSRADTLLAYLREAEKAGLSEGLFHTHQIERDLERLRTLDVGENINVICARLEYNLTKALLRYSAGQQFGFVNPHAILNRVDIRDSDSVRVTYRRLYDVNLRQPNARFYEAAISQTAYLDSLTAFLRASQPENILYRQLLSDLNQSGIGKLERIKLLCNIERTRWRQYDYPQNHQKYVVVNIPAYSLYAHDHDMVMAMRVACGARKTKTPLLTSQVMRMDLNPQWIIPGSIAKKEVAHHADDPSYFERNHYYVRERKTGRKVPAEEVTYGMLVSPDYLVVQYGGQGNSLGRIIFRFPNNFSVFLHDTSTPWVFAREDRAVSHGCVRIERPFDFAVFLLSDKDSSVIDKIEYSMQADISPDMTPEKKNKTLDRSRLIGSKTVEPQVPLFITYYTVYPDEHGTLCQYPDVYGYDALIWDKLKVYCNDGR